jgi:hypothetical protein
MQLLIITSCTGEKQTAPDDQLTLGDFRQGATHVGAREGELRSFVTTAGEIYTGEQHVRLMRGVSALRASDYNLPAHQIDLHILSAGYGLIPEARRIAPYECTFATMSTKDLRAWADSLNVPKDFRATVRKPYDLVLILLGDNYLQACQLDATVQFGGFTLLFCGQGPAKKVPRLPNLRVVTLSNPEAKRFSCGLVGLKGEVAARLLKLLANDFQLLQKLRDPATDVLALLDQFKAQKKKLGTQNAPAEQERQRFTFFTPRTKARMRYFIPEWDDRVDPDYDFLRDGITQDRDPYVHDVYAHEIYPAPNYDGILVSKSVIEDNKTKKERIRKIGIHRHVRVPRNFPVMGDCGAFNYIDEEVPPYETEETLDFYESLDFDFGVSIDHLIIPAHLIRPVYAVLKPGGGERHISKTEFERLTAEGLPLAKGRTYPRDLFEKREFLATYEEADLTEGKRRWKITLDNAKDFIQSHQKRGCKFTPIAGCQGYDVDSQVEMFKQQQAMGYKYIALGGMVRSKTTEILSVLEGVNRIRKPGVQIHVFGVARPEAITAFADAGVNSIDSARFLRQAWLSATSNYYVGDVDRFIATLKPKANIGDDEELEEKWRYSAVRVPPLQREGGDSLTAKASKLTDNGWTLEQLRQEEEKSLQALRAFDQGRLGLDATLKEVVAYDQLMGGDPRNEPHYRRLLTDKPWRACPCTVCQTTGIDVVIFRRNNRNRRRGFHNTWWFFQLFSKLTSPPKTT